MHDIREIKSALFKRLVSFAIIPFEDHMNLITHF